MSTVLNELRELTKKFPTLATDIVEAAKPVERPLADVAFVYNGFEDLQLMHLGAYQYTFKAGHITRIESLPNHREIDTERTKGSSNLQWMTIPLKGEFIARELIEGRPYHKKGLTVFLEEGSSKDDPVIDGVRVPKQIVADADARGEAYKLQSIEAFVVGREKSKAGIPGFKMRPDERVYAWMKQYRGDDEMFAERHAKVDSNALLAAAVEKMAEIAEKFSTIKEDQKNLPPRRRPGESTDAYKTRVAEWAMEDAKE